MITRRVLGIGLGSAILGWAIKAFPAKRNYERKSPFALGDITADMTTLRTDADYVTADDFFASARRQIEFSESVGHSPLSHPRVETPSFFPLS